MICPASNGQSFTLALENLKYGTTPTTCYTNNSVVYSDTHQTKAGITQMGVDMANVYISSGIKAMEDLGQRPAITSPPPSPPTPPLPPSPPTCSSLPGPFNVSMASSSSTFEGTTQLFYGQLSTYCFKVNVPGCTGGACCSMGLDRIQIRTGKVSVCSSRS